MAQSIAVAHQNLPWHESHQFLAELLQNPQNYETQMENYAGRVVSRLCFGDSKHYAGISFYSHGLLKAISPAAHFTNIIPQLKYLPEFISPWKRTERIRHDGERAWFLEMQREVEQKMEDGVAPTSFMRTFLESRDSLDMSDEEGAYMIGMVGLAGLLTTASVFMTYLLAMCLHPQWQAALQLEVDTVCGDRMPETSDAPSMPILRAVIKEIIRWRPVLPSSKSSSRDPTQIIHR